MTWSLIWPILVLVLSNVAYHILCKSTPGGANPFASLIITYSMATLSAAVMFFLTAHGESFLTAMKKTNWVSFATGAAIVGLEFGTICLYRSGWKLNTGNLVASIVLSCVLLLVGLLVYKEAISLRQIIGMAVCLFGLFLITR